MTLQDDLRDLLNRHSREGESDTPDFILAEFLATTGPAPYGSTVHSSTAWRPPMTTPDDPARAEEARDAFEKFYERNEVAIVFKSMNLKRQVGCGFQAGWHARDAEVAAARREAHRVAAERDDLEQRWAHAENAKAVAYTERNALVAALSKLWPSWLAEHPEDPDWEAEWRTIVFIDSPVGQLSWHLHDSDVSLFGHLERGENSWDGHTTEEKYGRLRALSQPEPAPPVMPLSGAPPEQEPVRFDLDRQRVVPCEEPPEQEPGTANRRPLRLVWGEHERGGGQHVEWHAPCGCAYHPEGEQGPHVHPCPEHECGS